MKKLIFDKGEWEKLKVACEEGYPKEVCGLLLGRYGEGGNAENKVFKVELLQNILNGSHAERLNELMDAGAITINEQRALSGGNYEFVIDPTEHYQKVAAAQRQGQDQIGIFHSHPDHPAVPSATDAAQPLLSGWSNIIVAVHQGKFKEMRSWYRETENSPFKEEEIVIQ